MAVEVKRLLLFQYILCYGSTLRKRLPFFIVKPFQYILCYGSTLNVAIKFIAGSDFNTSYVMVQHYTRVSSN